MLKQYLLALSHHYFIFIHQQCVSLRMIYKDFVPRSSTCSFHAMKFHQTQVIKSRKVALFVVRSLECVWLVQLQFHWFQVRGCGLTWWDNQDALKQYPSPTQRDIYFHTEYEEDASLWFAFVSWLCLNLLWRETKRLWKHRGFDLKHIFISIILLFIWHSFVL